MLRKTYEVLSALEYVTSELSKVVWILRAPIFVSFLSFWLLSTGQYQEVYISLADKRTQWPVFWAFVSVAALCGLLFLIARQLTLMQALEERSHKSVHGFTLKNLPGVLGIVPLAGVAYGLYLALLPIKNYVGHGILSQVSLDRCAAAHLSKVGFPLCDLARAEADWADILQGLERAFFICLSLGVAMALLILWRASRRVEFFALKAKILGPKYIMLFCSLLALSIITSAAQIHHSAGPFLISFIRALGPIFILNLFLIFLAFFSANFALWYDRRKIPAISSLIGLALVSSYLNWNDNHAARFMDLAGAKEQRDPQRGEATTNPPWAAEIPLLPLAFMDWFDHRPQRRKCAFSPQSCSGEARKAQEKEKPYPVYIVAAEGGGMYAAELAATVLARLYDRCPALKHHIFAISGVSGGSIGAGLIAALLKDSSSSHSSHPADDTNECDFARPGDELERKVKTFLSDDFLSPLGAAGLFPDFFQRFVPLPIASFDRAGAFEASLEGTWEDKKIGSGSNPLREGFRSHWHPDGNVPMLVLNTTRVENGQPIVVAPFLTRSIGRDHGGEIYSIYEAFYQNKYDIAHHDISLGTAMGLSARFPLVMPAAGFVGGEIRLADGGYFENSGVDTAVLMIRDLEFFLKNADILPGMPSDKARSYRNIEFRLLVLNELDKPSFKAEGLHELATPIRALYRARVQRGEIAISRAHSLGIKTRAIRLHHELFHMPLGWQLSKQTHQIISVQIGKPDQPCLEDDDEKKIDNLVTAKPPSNKSIDAKKTILSLNRNACVMREIIEDVSLKSPPPG